MIQRTLYLVGGPPRVGKSSLAQRLLDGDGIPWLPTDVIRTVVRRVLPDLDALDQGPVDAELVAQVAESMYPHIEQAAEVCVEEAERFLIEGFEIVPSHCKRLRAALTPTDIRACFLGHEAFARFDLARYRGPKPQGEATMAEHELEAEAARVRARSRELRTECVMAGLPYVDVGTVGFDAAMNDARHRLLA
jgi:hypothetical protein